ncbi:MAG: electron transfer flavoprotein subunit alpha [Alphaproteobacteria bacterium]|nr:electron transfer flavoprotein subunit alpha [Alphaproteobacteria bacterium]
MTILVIAEHDNATLNGATRAVVSAAQAIGGEVHVLVAGSGAAQVATQAAALAGVGAVLHADAEHYKDALAENMAALIVPLAKGYSHVLAAATSVGKDVMPRVAALLDMQQISEITKVVGADTFVRPIYAGNALETVQSSDAIKVITVRPTAFDKVGDGGSAAVQSVAAADVCAGTRFVSMQASKSERPELASARVVVSGGRGLGSKENFAIIERVADKLGAAIGASRAAVDAGYVPNDYQVGQTGKVVAPELYIAVGISGAIQHLAGMKDSKVIVAINKDENAPIFEIADYGLVGDLFAILPELEAAL